jgi:hypothetical protein
MTPLKRHHVAGPEIVQFIGLLILIAVIQKQFGPGVHFHSMLSVVSVFTTGLFMLVWPMSLKARQ